MMIKITHMSSINVDKIVSEIYTRVRGDEGKGKRGRRRKGKKLTAS